MAEVSEEREVVASNKLHLFGGSHTTSLAVGRKAIAASCKASQAAEFQALTSSSH